MNMEHHQIVVQDNSIISHIYQHENHPDHQHQAQQQEKSFEFEGFSSSSSQGEYDEWGSDFSNHIRKKQTQHPSISIESTKLIVQSKQQQYYESFNKTEETKINVNVNESFTLNNNVLDELNGAYGAQQKQQNQHIQYLQYVKQIKMGLEITQKMLGKNSFQYIQLEGRLLAQTKRSMLKGYLSQYTKYVDPYYKIKSNQEKRRVKQQAKKHLALSRFQNITMKGINFTIWQKFLQQQNFLKNLQQKPHKTPVEELNPAFDDMDYFCQNSTSDAQQFLEKRKIFLQKLLITDQKTLLQLVYNEKRFFNIRFELLDNSKIRLFRIFQPKNSLQNQKMIAEYLKYRNIWRHISLSQVFNQNNLFKQSLYNHALFQQIFNDKDYPIQIKVRSLSSIAHSLNNLKSYQEAMKKLQESKQILQKSKNTSTSQYITIIFCIGVVHQNNNKFQFALKYYKQALKLIKQYQKQQIKNKNKQKLKIKSSEDQKYFSSSSTFFNSFSFSSNSINYSICYSFIANLYFLANMYKQALHWYLLALKMIQFNRIQIYFVKYAEIAQKIGQIYSIQKCQNRINPYINIKLALKYYMQTLIIYQAKFGEQDLSYIKMQTKIIELVKKHFQIIKSAQQKKPLNLKFIDMESLKLLFINNDNPKTCNNSQSIQNKKSIKVNANSNANVKQDDKQIQIQMNDFIALITDEEYHNLLIQQFQKID